MLERIDSKELTEQYAFWRRYPYGDETRMLARLGYLIAAANKLQKQGGVPISEDDLMPVLPPRRVRKQTDEEVQSAIGAVLGPLKKAAKQKAKKK